MSLRTAVIPVAGMGTRFLPITKAVPKELLPLVDRPIIEYIVREVRDSGIERIVFVNSRGKSATEDYFDYEFDEQRFAHKKELLADSHAIARDVTIISVRQHKAMGLGHAILCAKEAVGDEPFAVLLGDDVIDADPPCTKQLLEIHEQKNGAPIVGVMQVEADETNKYGIVGGEDLGNGLTKVNTLMEKPDPAKAPSRLAIPGRYILPPEIFSILEETKPSVGGEIQLTDALLELANRRELFAYRFSGQRHDAGSHLGFLHANLHYALKRPDLREPVLSLMEQMIRDQ